MNRSVLLHICCGPCATYPVLALRQQGYAVSGYFYNPNIQPFGEHELRRESLEAYANRVELPLVIEPGYDLAAHLRVAALATSREERCAACYRLRLTQAARHARARGIEQFSTSLLVSPYQLHEVLREVGTAVGTREGVSFLYQDFRVGWAERGRLTREYGLYQQRFCGCVYSDYEAEMERRERKARAESRQRS